MPALFDKMVCLVGENPLPVYLGIKQLAAPEAEVVLVYSEATKPQAANIKKLLDKTPVSKGNRGRTCVMNQVVQLRDPFSPRQVRETLDAVLARLKNPRAYALNYTGGTKVMSDYGLLAWILMQQASPRKECSAGLAWPAVQNAFYLEEPSGKFHFHADEIPLTVAPTLDELRWRRSNFWKELKPHIGGAQDAAAARALRPMQHDATRKMPATADQRDLGQEWERLAVP